MERVTKKLSEIPVGKVFKVGGIEFIKFPEENGFTPCVTKGIVFDSVFGENNNNFEESVILKRLLEEFLPKIKEAVGAESIGKIGTDLTSLDGLKPYGTMVSEISLPTFDFYRKHVEIFDEYNPGEWWWLATPETAKPHYDPIWVSCVSPRGCLGNNYCDCGDGVRPLLYFVSSISVSLDE